MRCRATDVQCYTLWQALVGVLLLLMLGLAVVPLLVPRVRKWALPPVKRVESDRPRTRSQNLLFEAVRVRSVSSALCFAR
jgi:hypothetical protein